MLPASSFTWITAWRVGSYFCRASSNLCWRAGSGSGGAGCCGAPNRNRRANGIAIIGLLPGGYGCSDARQRARVARRGNDSPSGRHAANGCEKLEMPDHAAAHEEIVLAALARGGQGQIRRSRPEVANLAADTEPVPHLDIESQSHLEHACGRRTGGVGAAVEEGLILAEAADTAAHADPGRNRSLGKQVQARRGSDEVRLVIDWNDVGAGVEIFIEIEYRGHFSRNRIDGSAEKPPGIVDFEGESLAGADKGIEIGRARNALVADDRAANNAGQFVFLVLGGCGSAQNGHRHCQRCDYGLFPRHFPSRLRDLQFSSVVPSLA